WPKPLFGNIISNATKSVGLYPEFALSPIGVSDPVSPNCHSQRRERPKAVAREVRREDYVYQILRRMKMTTSALNLLPALDGLPPEEKQQVVAEILRRTAPAGEMSEAAFDELAAEVFRGYDAEEASRADR